MSQPPSYDINWLFIWEATDHYFCLENCSEWKYKIFTLYHAIKNNVPYQTIFQWHGIQPQNPVVISTTILYSYAYYTYQLNVEYYFVIGILNGYFLYFSFHFVTSKKQLKSVSHDTVNAWNQ